MSYIPIWIKLNYYDYYNYPKTNSYITCYFSLHVPNVKLFSIARIFFRLNIFIWNISIYALWSSVIAHVNWLPRSLSKQQKQWHAGQQNAKCCWTGTQIIKGINIKGFDFKKRSAILNIVHVSFFKIKVEIEVKHWLKEQTPQVGAEDKSLALKVPAGAPRTTFKNPETPLKSAVSLVTDRGE